MILGGPHGVVAAVARTVLAAEELGVLDEAIMFAGVAATGGNIFWRGGSDGDKAAADVMKVRQADTGCGSTELDDLVVVACWWVQAAFCSTYSDDSLVAVTAYRRWLAQPPAARKDWCKQNCVLFKTMRAAHTIGLELRQQLRREGMAVPEPDAGDGGDISEARANLLRRAICTGFFVNACYSNGSAQAGYTVAKIAQPVLVHPGSTVALSADHRRWVVYTELAKTTRLFIRGLTHVDLAWITEASPRFDQMARLSRLEATVAMATGWLSVGPGLIGQVIGRRGANLTRLEAELQCTLEVDASAGRCRLWCQPARRPQVEDGFRAFVEQQRTELMDETVEAAVRGSTRAVVEAGGVVRLALLRGMYTRVVVRGVAPDFKWDDAASKGVMARLVPEGCRVRSLRGLGTAADDKSSWGVVETEDVASAQRLVDRLDGSRLPALGKGVVSARPSFAAGGISDGGLVLDIRETSIKVGGAQIAARCACNPRLTLLPALFCRSSGTVVRPPARASSTSRSSGTRSRRRSCCVPSP